MRKATLLTKADCALCDRAKGVLERLADEGALDVELVDLSSPEGEEIAVAAGMAFPPGLLLDGEPFSYGRLSERKLRRELAKPPHPLH
ncbi:MAG: glutaredoxin family protein [Actinobacteria bacterium]|nr:glutaredoxin family protein [Actinomycetota bacterium]